MNYIMEENKEDNNFLINKEKFLLQKNKIILIKNENNKKAKKELLNDYYELLFKICLITTKIYKYSPLVFDDYMQYAIFKFFERTKEYNFDSNMQYATYIKKFITLDLNNYAKKYTSNKHKILNFSINKSINNNEKNDEELIFTNEEKNISITDIDFSFLNKKQKLIIFSIIKNEGDIKKVSKDLDIPTKTIYRHKNTIIKKLIIQNNID